MRLEKITRLFLLACIRRFLSGCLKPGLLFTIPLLLLQLGPISSFAQFTKLLDFGSTANGLDPYSSLVSDGTFLYGTTADGGLNGAGTIYKIKPDGTGFAKLLDFDGDNGSNPLGSLFFDGTSFLYGMASHGGTDGHGTLFKIMTDGTGFSKLLDFVYLTHGAFPSGSLISDGTFLYGMTSQGGTSDDGTLFKIMTDGTGFVKLLEFDGTTNGASPFGSLFSDGTFLYGMTNGGGSNFDGTIFKIRPDGTGYSKMLDFNGIANGSNPFGSLFSDGTFLYGTTFKGGSNNLGTIFKIKPDASGFLKLLDFDNATKGASPKGSLISDGTFLYGITTDFGLNGRGTIFKVKPDGTGFVKLLDADVGTDGPNPEGTLLIVGVSLYGVKSGGGAGMAPFLPGTIFKINPDGSGYTKLFSFGVAGTSPRGSLVLSGAFLYGMTSAGGLYNYGTIFKIMPDGTGFTSLLDFNGTTNGRSPAGGRLISDGTFLYGMTSAGGANDEGIIFKIKPDGTGFVDLLDFDFVNNGNEPNGSLIYDGTTFLYGMTSHGGANSNGTIFKIKPDGTGYVKLFDFNDLATGSYPNGSLFSVASVLYGMTSSGGTNGGWGTLFKINNDGTGFAKLIDFDNDNTGSGPNASLYYDGTSLYGMTSSGGLHSDGTVFKIKPDGTGYAKLLDFDGNNNGSFPYGSLTSDGTFLYGMTSYGGALDNGSLFKIKPDGTGYIKLYDFNDGSQPQGSLISDGTYLYGMTQNGGAYGLGTLFKSTLTPYVAITSFDPGSGVVGTVVTINGTDFDPTPANNIVKFNGITAVVKVGTATTLTVIVPAGVTSGPISVTASTNATSPDDFEVQTEATMSNGIVQNCNVPFSFSTTGDSDLTETFLPVNSADKVKVSFSAFDVGDILNVYDGPTTASPLLASLSGTAIPADVVATGPGGELTFLYSWQDSGSSWTATITCQSTVASTVTITTQQLTTVIGGTITLDLVPLITASNLDLTSLQVVVPPPSGATASIDAAGVLTINYAGINFSGTEQITIKACDTNDNCATQIFAIDVEGDVIVYNGISPNGANPSFIIKNINLLPDTKNNTVYIFDRWENQVWHGTNYDNTSVVFNGVSDGGGDLPSGVYFYKIDFASGRKKLTGFISLRRK